MLCGFDNCRPRPNSQDPIENIETIYENYTLKLKNTSKVLHFDIIVASFLSRIHSSEIPTTVPFPASPKTALWWEFLRFPPRLASLDSRRKRDGGCGLAPASLLSKIHKSPLKATISEGFDDSLQQKPRLSAVF